MMFLPVALLLSVLLMQVKTESFDKDPGWDAVNNRSAQRSSRTLRQDFGYSKTSHAGGSPGEIGGFITPAGEPAYYAAKIPTRTFNDHLTASGTLAFTSRTFHALIGFFNANTAVGWRAPNSISLRINGRGDHFYAYVEYTTGKWRAGGDSPQGFTVRDPQSGKNMMREFPLQGKPHTWKLEFSPNGNNGSGVVTITLDDATAVCHLAPGHKADGATFNRFGLQNVVKSADDGGEIWLDDLAINGKPYDFASDPKWEARNNRLTYETKLIRPAFDFGYSSTRNAGGKRAGEIGGFIFRGDGRYPDKMAYYGDRLQNLTMDQPLRASGKVSFHWGVSDSTTLFGFFHSKDTIALSEAQDTGLPPSFLGLAIEGPSSEGFLFYPIYRTKGNDWDASSYRLDPPRISPDGSRHEWLLEYGVNADGTGTLTLTLDGKTVTIPVPKEHRMSGAVFDRFGIVTTRIDGNVQCVFFDDLTYTFK